MKKVIKPIVIWLFIFSLVTQLSITTESTLIFFLWGLFNIYLGILVSHIPYEEFKKYTLVSFIENRVYKCSIDE